MIAALVVLPCLGLPQDPAAAPKEHWILRHQEQDGHWDADGFAHLDHETDPQGVAGDAHGDVRVTALAMLLLTDNNSDLTSGVYRLQIRRAARWLGEQRAGPFDLAGEAHAHQVRDHALATVALVELLASSDDRDLRSTAARWVDALEFARHPDGGWGAGPDLAPDALTTGWALVALRLAERAGLAVSRRALREGEAFQRTCFHLERGLVALRPEEEPTRLAPTALTLLERFLAGGQPDDEAWLTRARAALVQATPAMGVAGAVDWEDLYTTTLACYLSGGRWWRDWSRGLKRPVLDARPPDLQPGPHEPGGTLATNAWYGLSAGVYYRMARVILR